MTRELTKGANAPLDSTQVSAMVGSSGAIGINVVALLCGNGSERSYEEDCVFHARPTHGSGAVEYADSEEIDGTSYEMLRIDLDAAASSMEKIAVCVYGRAGGLLDQLDALSILLTDSYSEDTPMVFVISDLPAAGQMVLGEFCPRDGQWNFHAVGEGYSTETELARNFGMTWPVDSESSDDSESADDSDDSESSGDSDDSESSDEPMGLDPNVMARFKADLARLRAGDGMQFGGLDRLLGKSLAAPRLGSDQSASPALEAAADLLPQRKREWQQVIDHVWNTANQILEGFADSHPDIGSVLVELDASAKGLIEAYKARDNSGFWWDVPEDESSGDALEPRVWIGVVQKLTTELRTAPVPWTKKGRSDQDINFVYAASSARGSYKPTIRKLAVDAYHRMRVAGGEKAQAIISSSPGNCPKYYGAPPPIGPRSDPMDPGKPEIVGLGPLNFYLGHLDSDSLSFSTTSYGGYETREEQYKVLRVEIPVVIDLDVTGALLVDDRRCIESSVLNLLSALPANQFLLKIFDPEHGGDSAKFLFGLGDAGERIIGDRIKTSDRELDDLLQSTEEHITFVTQKFLQGEHQSLTEYNRAAGEVAEAYQLMVLYDFPSGFHRGGRFDDDQLDRLSKIIRNGPRTGVFTILVTSFATLEAVLEPPDQQQPNGSIENVARGVPWFFRGQNSSPWMREILGTGPDGLNVWTTVDAPEVSGATATVSEAKLTWLFQPADPPSDEVAASQLNAVKRNIHSARDVQVTPERVAQLADQAQRSDSEAFGQQYTPTVAYPDQPDTWWRASSERAVAAHFGQLGAREVADLIFSSEVNNYSALIGGRPGSGKSVLIHSVIMSIATEYAPSEVELYLIDFKEGVEFKQYADTGLPHARVIAIQSERDFGLSVLQRVASEIQHRGDLFKSGGGGDTVDLAQYRARTGEPLKRLVLIIDEFQQLFYRDDKIAGEAAEVVELILRQGRAFGIHLLLASQSLAGMASLGRHVLGLIPTRIALQSSESDSRLILGEDNPDADNLVRAGEGILNRKGGHKDANERFQSAYWDPDARGAVLGNVASRARAQGCPQITTVFEGHKPADITTIDARSLIPVGDKGVAVPVGLPLTLDPEPLFARLRRESGSNLLIVDEHGAGAVAVAVSSLCQQGAVIDLLDFVGEDDDWDKLRDELASLPGVTVHGRRAMAEAISNLLTEIDQRESRNDYKDKPRVLVIAGMDRARDFDPEDSYNDESPSHILGRILRDGPDVGVFVLAWFSRPPGVKKRLDRQLAEFGQRLVTQASRDDSSRLIESDSAAGLKPGQGVLAHVDRGTEQKIRTFSAPSAKWLARFNAGARTG